ncbi:MAG: zinc-dependent alcohol dehydrogenase [Hyphomicrobiales bacterium]
MTKHNVILTIPEAHKVELVERSYPKVKSGYVIVRNEYAAVCLEGTRIYDNYEFETFESGQYSDYPDGLGHESVGVVDYAPPGSNLRQGDRVIIFQGDWCGQCHACRNALSPTYCESNLHPKPGQERVGMAGLQDLNGSESGGWAMAQYRIAPEVHCYRIPDNLDFKHAQAANCSVGVGWSNQELMNVKAGDTVLVGGIGFIALGHIISALHRNVTVIALIRNKYRQSILEQIGVEHYINPGDDDWLEQVKALTYEGQGADHSVECSGHPFYQKKCMAATRLYGTVNFSGHTPGARLNFSPLDAVTHPGHTLLGQHDVRMRDREGLVRCLMDPKVQKMVDAMMTHTFPIKDAEEAFKVQVSKKCGKILLQPQLV